MNQSQPRLLALLFTLIISAAGLSIAEHDIKDINSDGFNDCEVKDVATGESSVIWGSAKLVEPDLLFESFATRSTMSEVIVTLKKDQQLARSTDWSNEASLKTMRQSIASRQAGVLSRLSAGAIVIDKQLENSPVFSGAVSIQGLNELINDPEVEFIEPQRYFERHTRQGISLIAAEQSRPTFTGSGVTVAIVDDGVDFNHPKLGGGGFPNAKVIGGFDFADNDSNPNYLAGVAEAHGTACAGIAAGDIDATGDFIGGVAPGAKIAALKVFSDVGGGAAFSDVAAAWDWCVSNKFLDQNNPILVISNSLGGGQSFGPCDNGSPSIDSAAIAAQNMGITILASAGNEGFCNALAAPACHSRVISVGAVFDASSFLQFLTCVDPTSCVPAAMQNVCGSFKTIIITLIQDKVTEYSNSANFLDILAPAEQAYTTDAVGGTGYTTGDYTTDFGGTSAACPYAAGSVAVFQSAAMQTIGRFYTPDEIRTVFTSTGVLIQDGKSNITKPRISLQAALNDLLPDPPQPPTGLMAEPGPNGADEIILSWTAAQNATDYRIHYSENPGPPFVPQQNGTPASASSVGNVTSVSIRGLTTGQTYNFAVTASNAAGESTFSSPTQGTPVLPPPLAPTNFNAYPGPGNGEIIMTWDASPAASGYIITYANSRFPIPNDNGGGSSGVPVAGRANMNRNNPSSGSNVGNVTQISVTGLVTLGTYTCSVRAVNAAGESGESNQDTTIAGDGTGDDSFEANDSINAPITLSIGSGETNFEHLQLFDDDWYRIQLPLNTHMRATLSHKHSLGDLNFQLWDRRSAVLERGEWGFAAGESYSTTDGEQITYVNLTAPQDLFLRVYGEGGATNPEYSLNFQTIDLDDSFDLEGAGNDSACFLPTIQPGFYPNLVVRDDDWFRVDTSGLDTLNVRADFSFFSGDLHLMIAVDDPPNCNNAFNNLLAGSFSSDARFDFEEITGLDVSQRNSVLVRVYGATRQTNYCDLTISGTSSRSAETQETPNIAAVPKSIGGVSKVVTAAKAPVVESLTLGSTSAPRGGNDSFEPNNNFNEPTPIDLSGGSQVIDQLVIFDGATSDEDWYAVQLPPLTHMRVTMNHDSSNRDLQLSLWDRRSPINEFDFGFAAGSSFTATDNEVITYVNNTAPESILLRVYSDVPGNPAPYSLSFETFFQDDQYDIGNENNDVACDNLPLLAVNQKYSGLICRDDDWYRFDVSAFDEIDVRVDHLFFSGNLHLMVAINPGNCELVINSLIAGGFSNFSLNNFEEVLGIDVNGLDTVYIRVYGAIRQTNLYDLTVTGR